MYQLFFKFYGGLHVLAGVLITLWPSILSPVLVNQLDKGAGMLIGTFSLMTGLGFYGAAHIDNCQNKLFFIKLALLANLANGAVHISNSLMGNSPGYMAYIGLFGVSVFIALLVYIYKQLVHQEVNKPILPTANASVD